MPNTKHLCASDLTLEEAVKLQTLIEPLTRYLGAPGDWGYGTKLGDLTQFLLLLKPELADAKHNAERKRDYENQYGDGPGSEPEQPNFTDSLPFI